VSLADDPRSTAAAEGIGPGRVEGPASLSIDADAALAVGLPYEAVAALSIILDRRMVR